jgi:hypothetical protein
LFLWTRGVLVPDHLLGFVRDGIVDLLERLLSSEQVVRLEECAAVIGEAVELPRVALPALPIVECDFFDDAGVDELLDVLTLGFNASSSYIEGNCWGWARISVMIENRVCWVTKWMSSWVSIPSPVPRSVFIRHDRRSDNE